MDLLKYFYDADCTREATTIDFEGETIPILFNDNIEDAVGGEPKRETIYIKFSPQNPRLIYVPDGKIEVLGDARLVESTIPRQIRSGESFALTFEWVPRNPPMTVETLEALSTRFRINGRAVAPAR